MKSSAIYFALILFVASCNKHIAPTAEVTHLQTKEGVITVRSTGYCQLKSYKDECVDAAQETAFKTLFYRGIPGSQQNKPLITIDEKSKEANTKFLKDFFEAKRYKTFITASVPVSEIVRQRKQKKITVDISINLTALRKDLEQSNTIPKFGY